MELETAGILYDTIYDIDAAVTFLTQEGFQNIFILGSAWVPVWSYIGPPIEHPQVKGIILESTHYSPDTQKKRLAKWGSTPTYEELYAQAQAVLDKNPYQSPHDETVAIYPARGPSRSPQHDEIFRFKTW